MGLISIIVNEQAIWFAYFITIWNFKLNLIHSCWPFSWTDFRFIYQFFVTIFFFIFNFFYKNKKATLLLLNINKKIKIK